MGILPTCNGDFAHMYRRLYIIGILHNCNGILHNYNGNFAHMQRGFCTHAPQIIYNRDFAQLQRDSAQLHRDSAQLERGFSHYQGILQKVKWILHNALDFATTNRSFRKISILQILSALILYIEQFQNVFQIWLLNLSKLI